MGEATAVQRIRFELELQPDTPTQRWRASVRRLDDDRTVVFETPLELVRHLAFWSNDDVRARGVR